MTMAMAQSMARRHDATMLRQPLRGVARITYAYYSF